MDICTEIYPPSIRNEITNAILNTINTFTPQSLIRNNEWEVLFDEDEAISSSVNKLTGIRINHLTHKSDSDEHTLFKLNKDSNKIEVENTIYTYDPYVFINLYAIGVNNIGILIQR